MLIFSETLANIYFFKVTSKIRSSPKNVDIYVDMDKKKIFQNDMLIFWGKKKIIIDIFEDMSKKLFYRSNFKKRALLRMLIFT